MTKYLMAGLALAVAALVLALSFPAEAQLQETTTTAIDPRIAAEIERDGEIEVLISLRDLDDIEAVPMAEWTKEMFSKIDWDLRAQHAQEVQAVVRAALGPDDATAVTGFKTMPGLGATITAAGLEKLRNHPDVTGVSAAALGSLSLNESSSLIGAGLVHSVGYDGTGVTVAVFDSGIDTDHPDLQDSIVAEICFPFEGLNCGPLFHPAEDIIGHGTRVSGDITSNGTVAPKGIAPGAGIRAYRITNKDESTNNFAIAAALEDLRLNNYPVDFVNMSYGQGNYPGVCDTAENVIELELAGLRFNDVLAFAASGNQGTKNGIRFPACNQFVVSVGAVYDQAEGHYQWNGVCKDSTTAADKAA